MFVLRSISWKAGKVISMSTICLIQYQTLKKKMIWIEKRKIKPFAQEWGLVKSIETVGVPSVCLSELGHCCSPWLFEPSQTPPNFWRVQNMHMGVYPYTESAYISFQRELLFLLMISEILVPKGLLQGEIKRICSMLNSALFQWPWVHPTTNLCCTEQHSENCTTEILWHFTWRGMVMTYITPRIIFLLCALSGPINAYASGCRKSCLFSSADNPLKRK